ncbi:MAG: 23S rRNA (uracil(1939)-C(5))-methyltransferase RlmD [Lachnospiraceae bacterium]|nr:23S rRNA (uracil(1939)-C(5))-methyltransferase RlmD [Lachnospiraceae bacterium]
MADKKEKIYRVKCKAYDSEGRGIVHFNGSNIPVEGLIIGEMAHIALKHTNEGTIGILKDVEIPSKDRVRPVCPYYDRCGGCQLMFMKYNAQLDMKQQIVEGLIGDFCKVEPVLGMVIPENFRTKVHATFSKGKNGRVIAGTYEPKSHRVIDINNCCIQDQKANDIIVSIKKLMQSERIEPYDEDRGRGILRHVLIRTGFKTGQVMVVLVVGSGYFPGKKNFVHALTRKHREITTVVINENSRKTSMILGEKEEVVYGPGYIEDELCGIRFRISPKSFYQVNPAQTEVLYQLAIKLAQLDKRQTVLDAYCGIGTISLICADSVREVIGVELNSDAVKNARSNAKINHKENVRFYCEDAGNFMKKREADGEDAPDVVFTDPPRSGCSKEFLKALAKAAPKRIVYISCNPVTLQRDLQWLTKHGYKAVTAVPVDMFGMSKHVETVVLLQRKDM